MKIKSAVSSKSSHPPQSPPLSTPKEKENFQKLDQIDAHICHISNHLFFDYRLMNESFHWSDGQYFDQSPDLIAVVVLIISTITLLIGTKVQYLKRIK